MYCTGGIRCEKASSFMMNDGFKDVNHLKGGVLKYFEEEIQKKLSKNNILISAHGNSIRALCKYLFKLDNNQISSLEIPTGNPLLIKLNEKFQIIECKYLDKERAKSLLVF